jgi:tetratricopeptide (TPR) repeat protein
MAKISAFVGHSFLPEDEALVRKFTDFLDQLKKSHDFDWVHATEPRPEDVASKVIDLIEGRNLFIGICTPNERVAKSNYFMSTLFRRNLKIKKEELQSKTSDWIIQEIGLAIGRKMKIMILLQEGVRQPGSLQGNIEYIPFDRNTIEKSFSSILGMITRLQGSGFISTHSSGATIEATASGDDHEEKLDHNTEEPNENWDEQKFDLEYFKALIFRNKERAKYVSDTWLDRVGSNPESVAIWETSRLLHETNYTDENHLSEIKSIADKHPNNPRIQENLAQAYEYFEDYGRAKERFQISLENSESNSEKRKMLAALARVCQKIGDINGVDSAILKLRSLVDSSEDEIYLLSTLEKLTPWQTDNKMLKLSLRERELEIDPADTKKRFQLAYAHSESDNRSLAMYHYEKIPISQRDSMTWNNLGVAYQGFSLAGLAISAFQTAANQGETLAMSNLAEKLISAGFLKEAQNELLRARGIDYAHKNIAQSQVRLDSINSQEAENKATKLEGAPELSQFLSAVGHRIWQALPSELGGTWSDKDVSLVVSRENDRVLARGSHHKPQTGLGLRAATMGMGESSVDTYDVTVSGRFVGSVLVGEYSSERRGYQPNPMSLLGLLPSKNEFIAIFDYKRRVLRCLIDKDLKEFDVRD